MALDPLIKVEITAHTSVIDNILEELQKLSVIQIDPHSINEWKSEKEVIENTSQSIVDLRKKTLDLERALGFLEKFKKKESLLEKLSKQTEELSKQELKSIAEKNHARSFKDRALNLEKEISDINNSIRNYEQKMDGLLPFASLTVPIELIFRDGETEVIISRLDKETYSNFKENIGEELIHIEEISGEEIIYFYIAYHKSVQKTIRKLEKDFHFEPIPLDNARGKPLMIIENCNNSIKNLKKERDKLYSIVTELTHEIDSLKYYYDYLQTELEKENAKKKFFYTKKVFIIDGWLRKSDYQVVEKVIDKYKEAYIIEIEKEKEEIPPVAYKNNKIVSPFELIVNLYSPPRPDEVLVLIKPRNGLKKFLNLFLILGISTFVIGTLIGTVFGINFDILPENLAWLRQARYKVMIFDSSKDVLTFFGLALGLGIIHLITGYIIKMYMLFKSGDWISAVCDQLPWIILLLSPVPKLLAMVMPDNEQILNTAFYVLLALWAGILLLFSERSTLNPIKRLGKGLFTIYGVSGLLADVLSYSRLLALGLATGVIAGVMNTLAGMVRQMPIIGIVGFVIVLLVGHLFNLLINSLSAFVHSIRLQFMEFFTKFYTGGGELLTVFSEKRKFTYIKKG